MDVSELPGLTGEQASRSRRAVGWALLRWRYALASALTSAAIDALVLAALCAWTATRPAIGGLEWGWTAGWIGAGFAWWCAALRRLRRARRTLAERDEPVPPPEEER